MAFTVFKQIDAMHTYPILYIHHSTMVFQKRKDCLTVDSGFWNIVEDGQSHLL
jgi:hypothetical protein